MGKIVSIVHTPAGVDPRPPDHYARIPVDVATLAAGRGIVTDRKGSSARRQLNIMSQKTLDQLRAEGYRTGAGQMGEQIVIAGIDIDRLPAGTRLQLGNEVVIEVDKPRTGCGRLQQIQGCTPDMVDGRLGVMARVLTGGPIRVGDEAMVLSARPGGTL